MKTYREKWCTGFGFVMLLIVIMIMGLGSITVFSNPARVLEDYDDIEVIGEETWRVWTSDNGANDDVMFDRVTNGVATKPDLVHKPNLHMDMDSALTSCDNCKIEDEKIWVAWERLEEDSTHTDIILSSRSSTVIWGKELTPHNSNTWDDFNPDILGDSKGCVWIAWVAYFKDSVYQIRYTYYNGLGQTDNDNWWAEMIASDKAVGQNSEPELFEEKGEVKVRWLDNLGIEHVKVLPRPHKPGTPGKPL